MSSAAIIGSGPAGLSCAERLHDCGVEVTVFEALPAFGGIPAYAIPEFRMPLKGTQKKIIALKEKGARFEQRKITSVKELLKVSQAGDGKFDFVVLAIGAGEDSKISFEGENGAGVFGALEFLREVKLNGKKFFSKGEKVAIIGGGNSTIDSARVAVREGADVTILYRRTEKEMPAYGNEVEEAKKEGVRFLFLRSPKKFICPQKTSPILVASKLVCAEMKLGEKDSSGRAWPIDTGKECEYFFSKIIVAAGQGREKDFGWLKKEGVSVAEGGKKILVNEKGETSLPCVYACGDCVTGPKSIADAAIVGIKVAEEIIKAAKK